MPVSCFLAIPQTQFGYIGEKEKAGVTMMNTTALEMSMHIKNRKQAGVTGRLPRAQYWASPEGQRRKELRRLDRFASVPRDMTPRLVKKISREATS